MSRFIVRSQWLPWLEVLVENYQNCQNFSKLSKKWQELSICWSVYISSSLIKSRVWRSGPGNSRSRDLFSFFDGIGTGNTGPVSEKFGTKKSLGIGIEKIWYRKKSRNRYWKNLVPKKVSESVSEKFGTGKKSRNRYWKLFVPELIFVAKIYKFWKPIIGTGTV